MDLPVEYEPDDDQAVMDYVRNSHMCRATLVNSQITYLRELRDRPGISMLEKMTWAKAVHEEKDLLYRILEEEIA